MKPVVIIGEQDTLKDALDALINKTSALDTKFAVPAQGGSLKPSTFESCLTEPQRLNRKQRRAMAKRSRCRNRRK